MFVDPTRGRSQGFALVAAAAGVLALGACDDPEQNTDLRPDGDPEVLAVLVMNDAANHLVESATYCALNDKKRPGIVGLPDFTAPNVCPDDLTKGADEVTNAYPDDWYVRIMFDELLDPAIEELTEIKDPDTGEGTDTYTGSIANTHPVKLECESVGGGFVEVPYDGYYSPAGNAVTWPLGPSLVIKPNIPKSIATGKSCRVTINDNVVDKTGNKVPTAQRGAYNFKIAPISVVLIDPPDDPDGASPIDALQIFSDNFYVQFNTAVDPASLCDEGTGGDECEFKITPEDVGACSVSGEPCVLANGAAGCAAFLPAAQTCDVIPQVDRYYAGSLAPFGLTDTEFYFGPAVPVQTDKSYKFTFLQGAKVADRCGVETTLGAPSVKDQTEVNFKTNKFGIKTITPGSGDLTTALKRLDVPFNNVVDVASLEEGTDYTLTPAIDTPSVDTTTGGDIIFYGNYALDTTYTFTLKAGAKIKDVLGAEYTVPEQKVVTWKTQPAVTVTTTADKTVLTKATATSATGPTFTFNQSMDPASLTAADYTFTDSTGAAVTATTSVGTTAGTACGPTSTGCQLRVRANLAPGEYKFTLKAGANITGVLGASYTQAADKVINLTVKIAEPVTPITCL